MITNAVSVEIVDDPQQAPKYQKEQTTLLKMEKCIIVGNGMSGGNPSVDLQLVDENGNQFVIMATGKIIEMIGGAVTGKRERDQES